MIPLMIGTTELILLGGIALLLFGGKKLPELMRGLGQGVRNFKEGMNEVVMPEEEKEQTEELVEEEQQQDEKDKEA